MADGMARRSLKDAPEPRRCSGGQFSGLYGGVNLGWARYEADTVERELVGLALLNDSDDAFTVGVTGGYNLQCGALVLGVEADFNYSTIDIDRTYNVVGLIPLVRDERTLDWFVTLRGRAGLAVDNVMFYATGGLAFANIDHTVTALPGLLNLNLINSSDTRFGWTIGGGIEYYISDRISLKSEALYIQFEDERQNIPIGPVNIRLDDRDSMFLARFGLNLKLGGQ
jgi:outer membrane immunogenic protein